MDIVRKNVLRSRSTPLDRGPTYPANVMVVVAHGPRGSRHHRPPTRPGPSHRTVRGTGDVASSHTSGAHLYRTQLLHRRRGACTPLFTMPASVPSPSSSVSLSVCGRDGSLWTLPRGQAEGCPPIRGRSRGHPPIRGLARGGPLVRGRARQSPSVEVGQGGALL